MASKRLAAALVLWACSVLFSHPCFSEPVLSKAEISCIEDFLYTNECSGKEENLIVWLQGEEFPSLGVGHFIWYPEGYKGPYQESFPALLSFMELSGVYAPEWIRSLPGPDAPWRTREEFLADRNSPRMEELRDFLVETKRLQTDFSIRRVEDVLSKLLRRTPEDERASLQRKYDLLFSDFSGMCALIDYVNFKGEGLLATERYQGEGWGLLQVLNLMDEPAGREGALAGFVRAAKAALDRRVDNAPPERREARWLPGWKNRVDRYLNIACGQKRVEAP